MHLTDALELLVIVGAGTYAGIIGRALALGIAQRRGTWGIARL